MQKDEGSEFAQPRRGEVQELLDQVQEHAGSVPWHLIDRRGFVNNLSAILAFTNAGNELYPDGRYSIPLDVFRVHL